MHIEAGEYDLKSFCREIIDSQSTAFQGYHINQVKAYFYLFEDDNWKEPFENRFDVEEYGDVLKLSAEYTNRLGGEDWATFFVGQYEGDLLTVLTAETEDAIDQVLSPVTDSSPSIASMPIVPEDFERLNEIVLSDRPEMRITEFKARRIPDLADANIRPQITDRTIEYKARDGRETLHELRNQYGVVPIRVQYEHDDVALRIDTTGKFTLKKINENSFNLLFNLVEEVVERVLELQEITQSIHFEQTEVESGNLSISVPEIKAGEIQFTKQLTLLMAEEFIEGTTNRERLNFSFSDVTKQAGSLDFSAKVSDETRNATFNISATDESMRIIPKHNCAFPSLIDFYLCFVQSVDEGADITLYEQEVGS